MGYDGAPVRGIVCVRSLRHDTSTFHITRCVLLRLPGVKAPRVEMRGNGKDEGSRSG